VNNVVKVNSPSEELEKTCSANMKTTAVIDASQFDINNVGSDSTGTIKLSDRSPRQLKFESESSANSLAVFSEIYYPGWKATIDGQEASIIRANYILRAIEIPAGKHTVEMRFEPKPYVVGNKVTMASSWIVLLLLLGSIGITLKKD
jgi:uncharacterized membrane protein YfhO